MVLILAAISVALVAIGLGIFYRFVRNPKREGLYWLSMFIMLMALLTSGDMMIQLAGFN